MAENSKKMSFLSVKVLHFMAIFLKSSSCASFYVRMP